jgi:hypothetical protein
MQVQGYTLFDNEKYALSIGFRTNSLLVKTRVKPTLYHQYFIGLERAIGLASGSFS